MEKGWHNEVDRLYKGMRYIVRLTGWGYRCGYVQILDELYVKVNCEELNCHGGITFSGPVDISNCIKLPKGCWLGFDCNHYEDGMDRTAVEKLIGNTKYFREHVYASCAPVSSEEVERDCKSLIDQILNEEEKHV